MSFPTNSCSTVIESIVAFVEDEAITLTELDDAYKKMSIISPEISKEEVMNIIINRLLLLKEASKMKLDSFAINKNTKDISSIIDEYVDIKIKSLIFVRDEEVQQFYDKNKEQFKGDVLTNVKDKIEAYLIEKETNKRLKEHLELLRSNTNWGITIKK
ncbi:MAG TPA: hypothetical protein HPP56_00920 [Nitrospirae bacterium]|nr:hypothetical protein [Nitrospirota bacterium]